MVRKTTLVILIIIFFSLNGWAAVQQAKKGTERGPVTNPMVSKVSLTTGNFASSNIDFEFSNKLPISILRVYNSRSNYQGLFGLGWSFPYDTFLQFMRDGSILLRRGGGGQTVAFLPKGININHKEVVSALIAKLKKKSPGKSETYWKNEEKKALAQAFYRRSLLVKYYPYNVNNRKYLKGKIWVNRSGTNMQLERLPGNRFRFTSHLEPIKTFDGNGNLVEILDRKSGSVLTLSWKVDKAKKRDRLITVEEWDKDKNKIKKTGRKVTFRYNNDSMIKTAEFVDINKSKTLTQYSYQKLGKASLLHIVTDGYNNQFTHTYDNKARLVKTAYHDGTTEKISYHQKQNWVVQYVNRDGNSANYTYIVDSANPLRQTVSASYRNKAGKSIRKPEKYEYTFARRKNDNSIVLVSLKEKIGKKTKLTKFNKKQLPTFIDQNGVQSLMKYDNRGRMTEKKDASGLSTFTYTGTNMHPGIVKRNGIEYRYTQDAAGLITTAESAGRRIDLTYNRNGRIKTMLNKKTNVLLSFRYNRFGQPLKIHQKNYGEILFKYSDTGEVLDITSKPFRKDVSPVMVANNITKPFQEFLSLMVATGQSPVFESGWKLTAVTSQGKTKVL